MTNNSQRYDEILSRRPIIIILSQLLLRNIRHSYDIRINVVDIVRHFREDRVAYARRFTRTTVKYRIFITKCE